MNAREIVNASTVGRMNDTTPFFGSDKTIGDYKAMLVTLVEKALPMIPGAIVQLGKEEAGYALDGMLRKAIRQTWTTSTQYFAEMSDGHQGLTEISKSDIGDVIRILTNIINQA